jgi:hypothetical protein
MLVDIAPPFTVWSSITAEEPAMSPFLSDLIGAASLTYQLENVREARK